MTDSEKLQKIIEEAKKKIFLSKELYKDEGDISEYYAGKYIGMLEAYEDILSFIDYLN